MLQSKRFSSAKPFLNNVRSTAGWITLAMVVAACGAASPDPSQPLAKNGVEDGSSKAPAADEGDVLAAVNDHTVPLGDEVAPEVDEEPMVALPAEPHVYATEGLVKIYKAPDAKSPIIGALRAGQSVAIKSSELITTQRIWKCTDGWYAIQPRGYVCVGGPGFGTLDGNDVRVAAARLALPDLSTAYPFKYGTSVGAPKYRRIPTEAEQRELEPELERYLADLPQPDPKDGAVDASKAGKGPPKVLLRYFEEAKPPLVDDEDGDAYEGMKVSWTREFDAAGRTWLLTPNMYLVPKDKVRVKDAMPDLQGIDLKKSPVELPLAFMWLEDTVKWRRGEDGKLHPTEEKWLRHSFVPATTNLVSGPGTNFREMRDGTFVKWLDASIITAAPFRPGDVGPDEKWVYVKVMWGYLIAYEGDTPVYVTAISPGAAGIQKSQFSTRRGKHFVGWKMLASDMSGVENKKPWFVDEVPWSQYYWGNYALHGAWWHNNFGRPMSHGCINLSPADAKFMFSWTEPELPKGWWAVIRDYPSIKATMFQIRP